MLSPLKEWICDTCKNVIKSAEDGYVEWIEDDSGVRDFVIVHHILASPNKLQGCYRHDNVYRRDSHLCGFTGVNGLSYLYRFIDIGWIHDPDYSGPRINDYRNFADFMRRITIPYYEEARLHFRKERDRLISDGVNDLQLHNPEFLKSLIVDSEST